MEDNRTKTILLVEDEAIIAITETQILRKHGYEVVTANSGEKAIEAVDIHPDISLILMDIDLGPGIDGTEAAERILATRDLPVAFLSSHTEPEVVEKTEGITSYGYIVKNSGETVLIASIKMAFRLYEAREELERYFTSSLDLLCIANTAGEFVRLNPEWERVLGYPVAELEGRSFLDFVHPEDRDATLRAVTKLDAGEDVTSFVNRLRRSDGSYRHIEWRSRPIGSEIYAAARDVTDRKQAEATLLEQKTLYRNLMENSSDGIELLDEAGNILNVNPKQCDMLGYSREELLGMTIADIDPNYPADGFYRFWKEQPKGSSILFETIHKHKDGTLIPVEVNGIFFTVHEKRYLFGVARDIRDRKQAEYEIQTREENLRITLNSIGDAVITTDINGRVTRMNPVAERLSGWDADTASGQALEDVLRIVHADSGDTVENPVARVLATGHTIGLANHTVLISRDGTKYQIADSAAPIRDDNGQTTGVVLVFRDVTEEYRIAQALSDSEHDMARAQALGKLGSWRFDLKNRTVTGSDQARRIYGIGENELTMEFVQSLPLPEFRPILDEALRALIGDGMPYDIEFRIRRPSDNSVRCIHSVAEYDAKRHRVVGTLQDITDRKMAEEEIRRRLSEKEALLKEVHHRIRNNMAQVESLLSIQADSAGSADVAYALNEAISRVRSIRSLYDKLLIEPGYKEVSLKDYLESLIDSVVDVFGERPGLTVEKRIIDVTIGTKKAIPVGIIINELLTNVFKYAFAGRDNGHILITLDRNETCTVLTVRDNGVGIDHSGVENTSPGFGLSLVKMLAEQLEATFTIEDRNGTESVLQFEV